MPGEECSATAVPKLGQNRTFEERQSQLRCRSVTSADRSEGAEASGRTEAVAEQKLTKQDGAFGKENFRRSKTSGLTFDMRGGRGLAARSGK